MARFADTYEALMGAKRIEEELESLCLLAELDDEQRAAASGALKHAGRLVALLDKRYDEEMGLVRDRSRKRKRRPRRQESADPEPRWRDICGELEPNQSAANAAICDLPRGHSGVWHEGPAFGPAMYERPGRFRWMIVRKGGANGTQTA